MTMSCRRGGGRCASAEAEAEDEADSGAEVEGDNVACAVGSAWVGSLSATGRGGSWVGGSCGGGTDA